MLLSPEVVELVGTACSLRPSTDGHALLLGMAASDVVAPASITNVQSSDLKGALELSVLPTGLQQLAVQVLGFSLILMHASPPSVVLLTTCIRLEVAA